MTYVIAEPCIDVVDRACVDECPVDCIYEGERALYIQPGECIDCGACEPVCPVQAIFYEDDLPGQWAEYQIDNARFFTDALPSRAEPLGSPGGAAKVGPTQRRHRLGDRASGTAPVSVGLPPVRTAERPIASWDVCRSSAPPARPLPSATIALRHRMEDPRAPTA